MNGKVTWLDEVDSTNEELKRRLKAGNQLNNFDVITARYQKNGRGQRENFWESQHGMNLTFSMYFQPDGIGVQDAFFLNQVISVLIVDFLGSVGVNNALIKWPNDILVDEKKICGVLIENTVFKNEIVESIIGIGLNVNQQEFFLNPRSTSIVNETNEINVVELLLDDFLQYLTKSHYFLGRKTLVTDKYMRRFFGLHQNRKFLVRGESFIGKISGVDSLGRLKILVNGTYHFFQQQEVKFSFD